MENAGDVAGGDRSCAASASLHSAYMLNIRCRGLSSIKEHRSDRRGRGDLRDYDRWSRLIMNEWRKEGTMRRCAPVNVRWRPISAPRLRGGAVPVRVR